MKKTSMFLTSALLLAVPASASAATTISAGPLKLRNGYQGHIIAIDNGKKDSLTVSVATTKKKGMQSHSWSFSEGINVTSTSIRGSLGKYGRVNLRLRNAKTLTKRKLSKGCTGKIGKSRYGQLTGTFSLKADSNFFKTIKSKRLTAMVIGANSKIKCTGTGTGDAGGGDGTGVGNTGPMLTLHRTDDAGSLFFRATPSDQMAMITEPAEKTKPASVTHMATGVGTGLILQGGGAQVPGLKQFITGSGTFTGLPGSSGPVIAGVLSGNLAVPFDSFGRVALEGDATLMTGL